MTHAGSATGKHLVFALILALFAAVAALPAVHADATPIATCGPIATPGAYALTDDLSSSMQDCIDISASDVSLDCGGRSITVTATVSPYWEVSGVAIAPTATPTAGKSDVLSNVTVENCVIQGDSGHPGYSNGVKASNVANAHIEGNTMRYHGAYNSEGAGISFYSVTDSSIVNNTAEDNGKGIYVVYSDGNTIENNNANSNAYYGIYLQESSNNVLNSNTANGNSDGITITSNWLAKKGVLQSGNNVLSGNTVSENNEYGIKVSYYGTNTLDGNIVTSNCNNNMQTSRKSVLQSCGGIILEYSDGNTLKNNQITENYGVALELFNSGNNDLETNTIEFNHGDGIYLYGAEGVKGNSADGNTIKGNTVNSNSQYGLDLIYSSDNIFSNNEVRLNGMALYSDSSTNNVFTNDAIKDSVGWPEALQPADVELGQSSNITFVSVDFNKENPVIFDDQASTLYVKWFANAKVTNLGNGPVAGATVSIKDVNTEEVYSGVTGADGTIPTQQVLEYIQNGASTPSPTPTATPCPSPTLNSILTITNYTPHSFAAVKGTYSNAVQTQVTQDVNVVIQLQIEVAPPVISNVHVIDVTQNTVTIGWETDKSANETLDYGTSTAYGLLYSNAAFATGHSAYITGLSAGTLYHYAIGACDSYANCAETGDYTFTTTGSSGGASGGGGNTGLPGGIGPSPTPTAAPTEGTISLGDGASTTMTANDTWTVFHLKYVAKGAFDGFIEWELPIDCQDYLNGIVFFSPDVLSVTCGSIKAVWEVKFLKSGDEFDANVSVHRKLPASAVNDVKSPKLTPRATQFTPTVTVMPTLAALASAEAPQPATAEVVAGNSSNYWLIGAIIAVAAIAAIAFYARKRKTAA